MDPRNPARDVSRAFQKVRETMIGILGPNGFIENEQASTFLLMAIKMTF